MASSPSTAQRVGTASEAVLTHARREAEIISVGKAKGRHSRTQAEINDLIVHHARQGKTVFDWLARHDIPYDELWFGKPQADLYIDDNGFRFTSWSEISPDGSNLPVNREKAKAANG